MTVIVGDVVSHAGKRWVVVETKPSPKGWPLNCLLRRRRDEGGYTTLEVSTDAPELLDHPVLVPGQIVVCHDGQEGTVVSDSGNDLAQVRLVSRRQSKGGGLLQSEGITDANRAQLIVDNYLS